MPSSQYHIQRLAEQLRQEIGTVIAREMRDPRIPPVVTVTHVKLAQDTRNATVHLRCGSCPEARFRGHQRGNGVYPENRCEADYHEAFPTTLFQTRRFDRVRQSYQQTS
jgi:hypothetical protein